MVGEAVDIDQTSTGLVTYQLIPVVRLIQGGPRQGEVWRTVIVQNDQAVVRRIMVNLILNSVTAGRDKSRCLGRRARRNEMDLTRTVTTYVNNYIVLRSAQCAGDPKPLVALLDNQPCRREIEVRLNAEGNQRTIRTHVWPSGSRTVVETVQESFLVNGEDALPVGGTMGLSCFFNRTSERIFCFFEKP